MTAKSHQRLDYLDALRGLAALSVICFHYNLTYGVPYNTQPRVRMIVNDSPLHLWWDGFAAVSLFFVLSGLVLSIRHFSPSARPNLGGFSYSGFLVSRICRILLPYLAVLTLSAMAWHFSAEHLAGPARSPWFSAFWRDSPTSKALLDQANLFELDNGGKFKLIPQAWSLAIEIVLSLLVPVGVLIAMRSTLWLLIAACIAGMMGGLSHYAVLFAMGIALGKHFQQIVAWLQPRAVSRAALMVFAIVLYGYRFVLPNIHLLHDGSIDWYISGIGAAMMLMLASASASARAFLSHGIMHHIGRVSYSIYLSHFAILLAVTPRFMLLVASHTKLHWIYLWAIGLVFTCAITIAISDLLYRLVEEPTIALGRYLSAKTAKMVSI